MTIAATRIRMLMWLVGYAGKAGRERPLGRLAAFNSEYEALVSECLSDSFVHDRALLTRATPVGAVPVVARVVVPSVRRKDAAAAGAVAFPPSTTLVRLRRVPHVRVRILVRL